MGWTRLTLLQRFTAVSAVIAVGLAIALSAITVRAIESFAIKDEAQVAAELVLRTVSPQLRPSDFRGPLPKSRREFLDALFRAHGVTDRTLRVRLWRIDGRLLYSNVAESGDLRITDVDLSTQQGSAAFFDARRQFEEETLDMVRFFVPVQAPGPVTLGAFEIFYDLARLQNHLRHVRRTVWTTVPLGLSILYGSVFVLVRRASRRLLRQQADLVAAHLGTYESLASAIDAKDSYTSDHSTRVADLAAQIAQAMRLPAGVISDMRMGARLHDLGKIGVPDAILMKQGPLDPDELAVMKKHAEGGFEILRKAPLSDAVKLAVRHSHEQWDGTGYPDGLAGEAIPLLARIVSVVDAYEAMTSDRPYRNAMPMNEALDRLRRGAGSQFDPRVVEIFAGLIHQATMTSGRWHTAATPPVRDPAGRSSSG